MSRKAFILWGLAIISFAPIATAIVQFLGLSKIIPRDQSAALISQAGLYLALIHLVIIPIAFGTVLHLRFKEIGRRKRILALCMALFLFSLPLPNTLVTLYDDHIVKESGAMARFWAALAETSKQGAHQSATPWTFKHVLDFVLIMLPSQFLGQIGLFALLAFGCLDPREPSKNRIVQFFKTGFQAKTMSTEQFEATKLAPA